MMVSMISIAPPPRKGGSRISCPLVDVNATEETGQLTMCGHPRLRDTPRNRYRLRRHYRRDHLAPFQAGTEMLMQYLVTGDWNGDKATGLVKVYRGSAGRSHGE